MSWSVIYAKDRFVPTASWLLIKEIVILTRFSSLRQIYIIVNVKNANLSFKRTKDATIWLVNVDINFAMCVEISGQAFIIIIMTLMVVLSSMEINLMMTIVIAIVDVSTNVLVKLLDASSNCQSNSSLSYFSFLWCFYFGFHETFSLLLECL